MRKEWFVCKCGKHLMLVDNSKSFEGVFFLCPKCKREVEITNKKESKGQNPVAS